MQNTDPTVNNVTGLLGLNNSGTAVAGIEFVNVNQGGVGVRQGALSLLTLGTGEKTNRMYMDENGNVGIGTTNPGQKLDVNGGIRISADMSQLGKGNIDWSRGTDSWNPARIGSGFMGANYEGFLAFYTNNGSAISDVTEKVRIINNGNVGIGTTTPTQKLEIAGSVLADAFPTHSDRRFKTGISPIDSSLSKICKLQGVYYNWDRAKWPQKNFPESKQIGLIAQDVEKVIPEVVLADKDGYRSLAYDKLTAVLIESVKEQQKQITAQAMTIALQQKQIDQLNTMVAKIQNNGK